MKKMINKTHIEGLLYDASKLEMKESGPNSKNPGTVFISGEISVATDNDCTNIVPVHFTYVTEKTAKGTGNATYTVLKNIVDGVLGSVLANGKDKAAKVRIDSAIGLNDFYVERNGVEELASPKRNEGGFVHTIDVLANDENTRNTFEEDMVITGVTEVEANEERNLPAKVVVRGCVFDFRNAILPVEFSVLNPAAMKYFLGLDISPKTPFFTKVKGQQVSTTIVRKIEEESAFGTASVREVTSNHKDWVITWAAAESYEWDTEDTITAAELTKAMADREVYLAGVKQRSDEYKASKNSAPAAGGFNF